MPSLRSSPWILGVPHNGLATLIWRISWRISTVTAGRPQRCFDFHRQYDLNPARCQRITVSGRTIASAPYTLGNSRQTPPNISLSIETNRSLLGLARRSTLICCLSTRISASSATRDRNRSLAIPKINRHKSSIGYQHRAILSQLPARLNLRQGQLPRSVLGKLDHTFHLRRRQRDPDSAYRRIWKWCRATAWRRVKEIMAAANIVGTHAMPKGLRHGFGVHAFQSLVPPHLVQRWLGHASLKTTAIYGDVIGPEERAFRSPHVVQINGISARVRMKILSNIAA